MPVTERTEDRQQTSTFLTIAAIIGSVLVLAALLALLGVYWLRARAPAPATATIALPTAPAAAPTQPNAPR